MSKMNFNAFAGLKDAIISPPFGTYIEADWATPVIGTFTYERRPGNKVWRAIKTLRPIKGGWVNNIGLRNPGLQKMDAGPSSYFDYLHHLPHSAIVSIHGSNDEEWNDIFNWIKMHNLSHLIWELNIS